MTKLILHGELGKKFGREYNLSISSPIEGIRALSAMLPDFKSYFQEGNYYVYTGNTKNKDFLDEDTVKLTTEKPIHIVPAVAGAKSKGVGKIIAGIALIGVAFIPGLNAAVFGALAGVAPLSVNVNLLLAVAEVSAQAAFLGGLTMVLGGASQIMAPKVGEQKESNLFSGSPESITEGPPVPLVYGEYLASGFPVSFEIVTGLNSYTNTNGNTNGGGTGTTGGTTGGWTTTNVNFA